MRYATAILKQTLKAPRTPRGWKDKLGSAVLLSRPEASGSSAYSYYCMWKYSKCLGASRWRMLVVLHNLAIPVSFQKAVLGSLHRPFVFVSAGGVRQLLGQSNVARISPRVRRYCPKSSRPLTTLALLCHFLIS